MKFTGRRARRQTLIARLEKLGREYDIEGYWCNVRDLGFEIDSTKFLREWLSQAEFGIDAGDCKPLS